MNSMMKKHSLKYVGAIGLSMISALLMAVFAMRMGAVIDLISTQNPDLFQKILSAMVIILMWFLISLGYAYLKSKYITDNVRDIKKEINSQIYQKDLYDYAEQSDEYYMNIFTKNMDLISDNYLSPRCDMVAHAISALVSIGAIFFIDWKLGFSFVAISLLTIVLSQVPGVMMSKKTADFSKRSADYLKILNNNFKGFEQVKLLGVSSIFSKGYEKSDENFEKSRKAYLFTVKAANQLGIFFSFFAQLMCVAIGTWFVLRGDISIGLLIASINLLNGVFSPIQSFVHNKNLLASVKHIKEEVDQLLKSEEKSGEDLAEPIESISFEDISFKFNHDKIIFEHFNLKFEKGKKYAIVGESGRGKSTLVKMLMKYYHSSEYSGHIRINGYNVNEISSSSLYDKIAYIQRNDFFVQGTVEENIALNRPLMAVHDELYKKLKFTPAFLSKPIGFGSRNHVSSGEKQRIDMARFLVRDYEAMVFDEPTSNLDLLTRNIIFDLIFALKDKLVIVITHENDLEILGQFDEVIRL